MAGVIIVGSLMFTSNKLHLFTGGVHKSTVQNSSQVSAVSNAKFDAVKPVALHDVHSNSFSDIAKQASPAVVKIETKVKSRSSNSGKSGNNLCDDPFFGQFFWRR